MSESLHVHNLLMLLSLVVLIKDALMGSRVRVKDNFNVWLKRCDLI